MSPPNAQALYPAIEATWPTAAITRAGPWAIRDGKGGGKRVSAATAEAAFDATDLATAEAAMRALGQPPLFWIREGEDALDTLLAQAQYDIIDPVTLYVADTAPIAAHRPPPVSTFLMPEPLAIMREIWATGGIGPARIQVMDRACAPKTTILGRTADRPVGTGFAAIHQGTAMVHALEVLPTARRQGMARHMMHALAGWAQAHGAPHLALAVTQANAPANALYRSLGMQVAGRYHYRIKKGDTP
ncbi:MAG: GNAT family N-acetyltransferase [Pseudomonadota bacterium]